ncbi:MAG: transporter substrate-binding domain-containing protein [Actinobacteria bacterium]|nr:transporter substrate-binding domain-containing protein [Actinomycetota bacterium]
MRLHKWLLLVFAMALIVAACGDDGGTTTTAAATTTSAAATTTTAAATTTTAAAIQTIEAGVLTIGSDIPYPPFEDFDAAGEAIGFDVDLMNEIARRLGLRPVWRDTDFDTIFTQLAQGNFDVVASATTITEEREEMVNFSVPYFNANQALTINSNETPDIQGVADLQSGDAVAVQTGTTGAMWAKENLEPLGIIIREFVQPPDCFAALEGAQVIGAIIDIDPSLEAEASRPGIVVAEEIVTGESYGFPVNPANEPLLAAINAIFAELLADGFYQQTYDKWIERPGASVLFGE